MIVLSSASNQYLSSVSSYTPFIPGTVCFWFKPTLVTLIRMIFQSDPSFLVRIAAGKLASILYRNSASTYNTALTINTLYHVVITWETSSGTLINFYLNSSLVFSETKVANTPAAGTLYVGQDGSNGSYLDSTMEDFRFYNRVLSVAEIESIYYSRGNDSIVYGLVNRWLMTQEKDSGSAITGTGAVKDYMDPGNHLTPVANPLYGDSTLKLRRRING